MAVPVILVDSATGSDSAASGAGPSTALTGVAGATDIAGTTVTLDALTDLTNVLTTGAHAIYFVSNFGVRRWAKITGKAGSGGATPTVTVSPALGSADTGKTWAIGGKRASLGSASSALLISNNGGTGDLVAGWTVQFASGHAETITSRFLTAGSDMGDTSNGPITIQADPAASVMPILTFTSGEQGFCLNTGGYWVFRGFFLKNTGAPVGSGCNAFQSNVAQITIIGCRMDDATDQWVRGVYAPGGVTQDLNHTIRDCAIGNCSGDGITFAGCRVLRLFNNYVHDCGGKGLNFDPGVAPLPLLCIGNIFDNNAGIGVYVSFGGETTDVFRECLIWGNTINRSGSHGIEIPSGLTVGAACVHIGNNILSNNGGYGLSFTNTLDPALAATGTLVEGNTTYGNTVGAYASGTSAYAYNACPWAFGDTNLDPTFTNVSGGDFSIGTNLKAKGYPLAGSRYIGTVSATYSYIDPGAAQRQESGGGAGGGVPIIGGSIVRPSL